MADAKLTAHTALTSHAASDIIYIVDAPGGTPLSRKITIANLFTMTSGEVIVLDSGSAAAPAIGWTDTGFYESSADTVNLSLGGTSQWSWGGGVVTSVWTLRADTSTSWQLSSSVSSATNPTLVPHRGSTTSGIGGVSGTVSVITGGTNAITVSAAQVSTFAAAVVLPAGSASAAALALTGEVNTGIFFASGQIAMTTAGNETARFVHNALRLGSAGQVGWGVAFSGNEAYFKAGSIVTNVEFVSSLTHASSNEIALKISYTTNKSSSGSDSGLVVNQTDTASPGVSRLLDLQVGGSSLARVDNTGTLELEKGTADEGFLNLVATADGDATSAISTNTTSGSTTHHIQIELNGTTAWIACSTTDPS